MRRMFNVCWSTLCVCWLVMTVVYLMHSVMPTNMLWLDDGEVSRLGGSILFGSALLIFGTLSAQMTPSAAGTAVTGPRPAP